MRRSFIETLLAILVIVAAAGFAVRLLGVDTGPETGGYGISAEFEDVGGLRVGDRVLISGLAAGTVTGLSLDPVTLFSIVDMEMDGRYRLPSDTRAGIGSGGLTGGASIILTPGTSRAALPNGGMITDTDSAENTVDALGQRIFGG